MSADAAREVANLMHDGAPALRQLKLGTNCFGSRFDDLRTFVAPFGVVDLGAERLLPFLKEKN
jgi:hypothetical protein